MPAGRPKRCQLVFTASMLKRTRNSRVTMPMISSLPPCELTTTSFLTPARATDAPSSVQASISVVARQRQRARRMQMLVRLADRLDRQDADVEIVGQPRDHRLQHAVHDRRVGRDRQMRPVLLDRRDRQHGDRRLRVDRRHIRWSGKSPHQTRLLLVVTSTSSIAEACMAPAEYLSRAFPKPLPAP